uniref:Uncharacterized protein n=1 Tax=Hucho hucho TaxID=62062 RepID=A0A4W5NVG2_9TELE
MSWPLVSDMFAGRGWGFMCFLTVGSCLIVGAIFLAHSDPPYPPKEAANLIYIVLDRDEVNLRRSKRQLNIKKKELRIDIGKDITFEVAVDQLGSLAPWVAKSLLMNGRYICMSPCTSWDHVVPHTERTGYVNLHTQYGNRWSIVKSEGFIARRECNKDMGKYCLKVRITLKQAAMEDVGLWYIRFDQNGADRLVAFRVGLNERTHDKTTPNISPHTLNNTKMGGLAGSLVQIVQTMDMKEVLEVETGYKNPNLWLEWIQYTAKTMSKDECYACGTAKPRLSTTPFPLTGFNSPLGLACMVRLFKLPAKGVDGPCKDLHYLYPPVLVSTRSRLPPFVVSEEAYYCFTRTDEKGYQVGCLSSCSYIENVTSVNAMTNRTSNLQPGDFRDQRQARTDI